MIIMRPCTVAIRYLRRPVNLERAAACVLGCVMTLATSCGGQQLADKGHVRGATPESTLSGCFSLVAASGMSDEDERELMSLNPIRLDTARAGPADTSMRNLEFTDRLGHRFGYWWYEGIDADSLFWRVGTEFGAIIFAGILDGSTFHAQVYSSGDVEPFRREFGNVRAERIRCPGGL